MAGNGSLGWFMRRWAGLFGVGAERERRRRSTWRLRQKWSASLETLREEESCPIVAGVWDEAAARQLKPEQLGAAEACWRAQGPRDYRLTYTIAKLNSADEAYVVEVRGGKAVAASLDGRALEPRFLPYYGMTELYDYIQRLMEEDAKPESPGAYVTASFDETTGRLLHYVRSVRNPRQRVEIKDVKVEPARE